MICNSLLLLWLQHERLALKTSDNPLNGPLKVVHLDLISIASGS
jgi:hypothetical protein